MARIPEEDIEGLKEEALELVRTNSQGFRNMAMYWLPGACSRCQSSL